MRGSSLPNLRPLLWFAPGTTVALGWCGRYVSDSSAEGQELESLQALSMLVVLTLSAIEAVRFALSAWRTEAALKKRADG